MGVASDTPAHTAAVNDHWLFGWDPTPGIVSVHADRRGRALVWQRNDDGITCTEERYRPWVLATTLDDIASVDSSVAHGPDGRAEALIQYSQLEGNPGSYRFHLSARDGQWLEQALRTGASKRLGRTINSLSELEDDYYRVGPSEQYLMQTGRVYFRDLSYGDLHRMQFDLETTSLSPRQGRIFMVAVKDSRGLNVILEAPRHSDEADLIVELCELVRERDPDIIENHNLFGFDLPFLQERAAMLGVPLRMGREPAPTNLQRYDERVSFRRRRRSRFSLPGRELIDTLDAVWRHDFAARDMPGHGLKAAARYFDLAAPERTYLPGHEVFSTYQHDPERVRRYALDDVHEVDALSQTLLGSVFTLAGMAPRRYESLASAGPAMGILEPMLVRAYLQNGSALPGPASHAAGLEPHAGGAAHLFAEGVSRQIVKADVASMYPSIMRVFHVGPTSDHLGVLLYLVDRLTNLRLHHKSVARAESTGASEARVHHAAQAAMKTLINSAYGYMGAGSMAIFADRHAADEVTRRGREILRLVIEALRDRGMTLLEADTDGVYFSAPDGWTEVEERALVADVATLLQSGISLEYEGRYRSMFVHEVKNYALLTYDGRLIVKGGAFHSMRSEPFGERFLHNALQLLLKEEIVGLHELYVATMASLKERRFTLADVATHARLTKSPEEYRSSRARLKEAPYEAMLASGRTSWRSGSRIRYFRTSDGALALLPEERDETPRTAEDEEGVQIDSVRSDRRDYDVPHYQQVLLTNYVNRLRKAFTPEDFNRLFRRDDQIGMFDGPIGAIRPLWIGAGRGVG